MTCGAPAPLFFYINDGVEISQILIRSGTMQCTMNKSTLKQLIKMGLINDEVLSKCEFQERPGDYKSESTGKPVTRTKIILPTYEKTIGANDYLPSLQDVKASEEDSAESAEDVDDVPAEAVANG